MFEIVKDNDHKTLEVWQNGVSDSEKAAWRQANYATIANDLEWNECPVAVLPLYMVEAVLAGKESGFVTYTDKIG